MFICIGHDVLTVAYSQYIVLDMRICIKWFNACSHESRLTKTLQLLSLLGIECVVLLISTI